MNMNRSSKDFESFASDLKPLITLTLAKIVRKIYNLLLINPCSEN